MQKRIAAALIVASTICWSMAPTASSLALRPSRSTDTKTAAYQHDCCPRAHRSMIPAMLATIPPATMPCGNQHPCCMQHPPDRSPALPVAKVDSRPDSTHFSGTVISMTYRGSFAASAKTRHEVTFESVLLRNTVLLI